jgi:hypothetical protein
MGKPSKAVRLPDSEKLAKEIRLLSRSPFQEMTSLWLQNQPTPGAIRKLSQRSPHLFTQSLTQLANLSGFSTLSSSTSLELSLAIGELSDADLNKRIVELQRHLESSLNPSQASQVVEGEGSLTVPGTDTPTGHEASNEAPPPPDPCTTLPTSLYNPTDQTEAPPKQTREVGGSPPLQQRQEEA